MSAGQTTQQDRYRAYVCSRPQGYKVVDRSQPFRAVDTYQTQRAAEYAARQLNTGMARVDSHAIVGCKVVAS